MGEPPGVLGEFAGDGLVALHPQYGAAPHVGDQVVGNDVGAADVHPMGVVVAAAVEQVEHRVLPLRIVAVAGRRVDVQPAAGGPARDVTPGDSDWPTWRLGGGDDIAFTTDGNEIIVSAKPAQREAWSTNGDLWAISASGSSVRARTAMAMTRRSG